MSISRKTHQPPLKAGDNPPASSRLRNTQGSIGISEFSKKNIYPLFDSISDAIFILDGTKIVDCNNKTLEMFACIDEQIINKPLAKYLPSKQPGGADSREKMKQIIDTVLQGNAQFSDWKFIRSDKIVFDAEVSFNCLELEGKKLIHCIARDITKRKGEEKLSRTLAVSSLIGIYVLHDGRFRFVNPKFQEYVGYSANELIGMDSLEIVHPEDRASVRENAVRMLKQHQNQPYEFRTVTKSGQVKWTMETVTSVYFDGKKGVLGNYVDINDRKKSEEILKASEERYRTILENIEDGYYEVDLKGILTFFNESLCKISGFSREELMGTKTSQYVDKNDFKKMFRFTKEIYQTGRPKKHLDFQIICKDGFKRHIEISSSLMRDLSGNPIGFRGIARDIDERKQAEATIFHMAYHDTLTGLPNRMLFNDRLNMAISTARRNDKKFAVMMLDLDGFKLVNDLLGHDIGDLLLQNVSYRLRGHLRRSDTVARMGGDEFMLLLPEINRKEDAEAIARKIINSFHHGFILKDQKLRITASIGIAIYPDSGTDFDMLKKNADIAMYKVKEKGRDNFQCYESIVI
ncbi:MAG: PAS domain S-box protein [Smithella sp.]